MFWSLFDHQAHCPSLVAVELNSVKNASILALLPNRCCRCQAHCETVGLVQKTLPSPVLSNHLFQCSSLDSAFQEWHRYPICIQSVLQKSFWIDNGFLSFKQLSESSTDQINFFFEVPAYQTLSSLQDAKISLGHLIQTPLTCFIVYTRHTKV